jgi:hypothetical protein
MSLAATSAPNRASPHRDLGSRDKKNEPLPGKKNTISKLHFMVFEQWPTGPSFKPPPPPHLPKRLHPPSRARS